MVIEYNSKYKARKFWMMPRYLSTYTVVSDLKRVRNTNTMLLCSTL